MVLLWCDFVSQCNHAWELSTSLPQTVWQNVLAVRGPEVYNRVRQVCRSSRSSAECLDGRSSWFPIGVRIETVFCPPADRLPWRKWIRVAIPVRVTAC